MDVAICVVALPTPSPDRSPYDTYSVLIVSPGVASIMSLWLLLLFLRRSLVGMHRFTVSAISRSSGSCEARALFMIVNNHKAQCYCCLLLYSVMLCGVFQRGCGTRNKDLEEVGCDRASRGKDTRRARERQPLTE
jgi:hypothetical protein